MARSIYSQCPKCKAVIKDDADDPFMKLRDANSTGICLITMFINHKQLQKERRQKDGN